MITHSFAKIKAEALAAAKTCSNVNTCCPYPFSSGAGIIYRKVFELAIKKAEEPINVGAAIDITHSLDRFEAVAR